MGRLLEVDLIWRPTIEGTMGHDRVVLIDVEGCVDSGLVCTLLGIRTADQLRVHPLRGAVFESWVAGEVAKARANQGRPMDLCHYRDQHGREVDLVVETDEDVAMVEAQSGETINADFFAELEQVRPRVQRAALPRAVRSLVVYGGEMRWCMAPELQVQPQCILGHRSPR